MGKPQGAKVGIGQVRDRMGVWATYRVYDIIVMIEGANY